jgi:amino acid adenylation domain
VNRIPQRWSTWAARAPDAPAVVDGTVSLSYAELDAWSDRLAARLAMAGIRPGDRVGVCLVRSPGLIAALLAVLKAGAAYVPLDRAEPRIAAMLADARPSAVVCAPQDAPLLSKHGIRLLHPADDRADSATSAHRAWRRPEGHPEDLAYLMYTSGSTGLAKAVMVEHRNVTNLVTEPGYVRITPADRLLQLAPVTFDAATFEIWGALLNGACLVLAPPRGLCAADLRELVQDSRITVLWLTAALFHQQIDQEMETFRGLHTVLAGGDVLSVRHVRTLRETLPECRIVNGYGPTETTTFACCHLVGQDEELTRAVPIGRPIQNVTARVLDPGLREVPVGEAGELCIGGAGVSRGYWARPELTAERFVADPFGPDPDGRLYRTGDLARQRPDGVIEFLGRMDDQFKLRGYRIEPGEIENVLAGFPGVRQAAAALRTNHLGDRRLVAWVVLACTAVDRRALRRFAAERLPGHMVPSVFVPVESLPVTRNGKVDRPALPDPEWRKKDSYV